MNYAPWFGALGDAELSVQLLHLAQFPGAYDDDQRHGLLAVAAGRLWPHPHEDQP